MDSVLVAFSGGADSIFLLTVAAKVLAKGRLLAVTADSPTYPKAELKEAKYLTRRLNVRHKVIKTDELENRRFASNPPQRCYFCKKELFSKLKSIAEEFNLKFVADGSSVSDRLDFRPGETAKKEFHIRSPLAEAHFSKEDIRAFSRRMGLFTWNKPAGACLASRIPYGKRISKIALKRVGQAEAYLKKIGFKQVRLRHYNGLCRIEVQENELSGILRQRDRIVNRLKKLGYSYVTLDLEGYRTGSMNEVLRKNK